MVLCVRVDLSVCQSVGLSVSLSAWRRRDSTRQLSRVGIGGFRVLGTCVITSAIIFQCWPLLCPRPRCVSCLFICSSACAFVHVLIIVKAAICNSTSIQLRFGFYSTTTIAIKIMIRLRFDSSEKVGIMEGMNSFQTTFHFGSRWKGYTIIDNRRMLPDVDPSAWMPFLLPWHTLLRHYMPRPLPSYWLQCLSTRRKNEHVHFSS